MQKSLQCSSLQSFLVFLQLILRVQLFCKHAFQMFDLLHIKSRNWLQIC